MLCKNHVLCTITIGLNPGIAAFYLCVCLWARVSPSDGDSVVSDRSSERDSTEENLRGHATPSAGKHAHKIPINVLNGKWPGHHSSKHRQARGEEEGRGLEILERWHGFRVEQPDKDRQRD